MDNHPIPQDVTHFQFKLIGELTIKQFGYVAAGGVLAWVTFSLPIFFLIKLVFALIFAGTGVIFAFIPIESRPADLMLRYFFRALFQPNQYLFQKDGLAPMNALLDNTPQLPATQIANTQSIPQQQATLPSMNIQGASKQQSMPIQQFPRTQNIQQAIRQPIIPLQQQQPVEKPIPVPSPTLIREIVQNQSTQTTIEQKPTNTISPPPIVTSSVAPQITPTVPVVQQPVSTGTEQTHAEPVNIASQLQDTLAEKKKLEEQLAQLQQQLTKNQGQQTAVGAPVAPPQPVEPVKQPTPSQTAVSPVIKKIAVSTQKTNTMIASDFPNIIMGVVKDARGNVLPNILIEVKDADDNPVRAFKTNAFGQFASATPLLNGTYTIVFEDSAKTHKFDSLQIEASGISMQPIEVISVDQREELRKELFG